jgi:putative transposase
MELRRQAHCVYYCKYHLVLVTKYRRKIFNAGVYGYFRIKLQEIRKYYPEIEFTEVNHDLDHVHLLLSVPPKMSVGESVRIIKCNTEKALREKFKFLEKVYYGVDGIWSEGYFVSTVGINEKTVANYVKMQGQEDSGQAKLEL